MSLLRYLHGMSGIKDCAITPKVMLHMVLCFVCLANHALHVFLDTACDLQPGHTNGKPGGAKAQSIIRFPNSVRDNHGLLRLDVRQQEHKLISSIPANNVNILPHTLL